MFGVLNLAYRVEGEGCRTALEVAGRSNTVLTVLVHMQTFER